MHRSSTGLSSGYSNHKRPTGEGYGMLLEPRQEVSAYPCSVEIAPLRILCRHIIIQAIHDLGCGRPVERKNVANFLGTKWFSILCEFSDWEEGWVRKIFKSTAVLRETVRRDVTRQVVHMTKAVAEVGLD